MKTVIEMAREAGWDDHHAKFDTRLESFAALVRADEREECAMVCDALHYEVDAYGAQCAAAIRARSNT